VILAFDLREDPAAFHNPTNRDILCSLFPGTTGVGRLGMFLRFVLQELPRKPWPKTVAGLPIYFALELSPEDSPFPLGTGVSRRNGSIAENLDCRNARPWGRLFSIIQYHFEAIKVPITEVMYWDTYVLIVLEDRTTQWDKLPQKVAKVTCTYMYEDQMARPRSFPSRQLTEPSPGVPDENEYDTLQPGIRITSDYQPGQQGAFRATTTGVLLSDEVGNRFMTAAAHGFPPECGLSVLHPSPNGRVIGELVMEVSYTDVALVSLEHGERFENVTFENEIVSAIQLRRLIREEENYTGGIVFIDSPDTGCLEGTFGFTSYQNIPSDSLSPKRRWAFTKWVYRGQDHRSSHLPPDGICGSAMWTEQGDVLGFFRYAIDGGPFKDWCVGIASEELLDRGYMLAS